MPSVLPSRQRLLSLVQASSQLFSHTYNPTNARLGNKILRARLTGAIRAQYYPPRLPGVPELKKMFPEYVFMDEEEDIRLEDVELRKERGKGAPKKSKGKKDKRQKGKK